MARNGRTKDIYKGTFICIQTLFEGFQILCTDYDYVLGKRGDSIQGRTLYEGGHIQGNTVVIY